MNLTIEEYNHDSDFTLIKSWFDLRSFPSPNPKFLPKTGMIVLTQGHPICAGFLFQSDAGAAIIGHLVSDPRAPGMDRNVALDALIEALADEAVENGFEMICCSTNLPRLMERFERHGFIKTDEGVANFGRVVCH